MRKWERNWSKTCRIVLCQIEYPGKVGQHEYVVVPVHMVPPCLSEVGSLPHGRNGKQKEAQKLRILTKEQLKLRSTISKMEVKSGLIDFLEISESSDSSTFFLSAEK